MGGRADLPTHCEGTVRVPAGPALLGGQDGDEDEAPGQKVHVPAFALDRCEVTVAKYQECVAQGGCRQPEQPPDKARPHDPVVWVSYEDAEAYCRFRGKRLPREEEWEKAARGDKGWRYPWGDVADCRKANYGSYEEQGPCAGMSPGHPVRVGLYPTGKSPYGALDMAGNVWEWTRSSRVEPGMAVARGGSCCSVFLLPRSGNRMVVKAAYRDSDIGFRCAAALDNP